MNPDEELEAAVRALRATPDASDEVVTDTERRVLAAVAGQSTSLAQSGGPALFTSVERPLATLSPRRRPMLAAAAALAVLGSMALASVRVGLLEVPRWLGEVFGAPTSQPRPVAPATVRAAEPPTTPRALDAVPSQLPVVPAPPRAVRPAARTLEATSGALVPTPVVEPPPGDEPSHAPVPGSLPAPVSATPDELYARGHRAHFVEKNPRSALEAWDAYLKSMPDGRFAPEARFNRAIDLVRLGRTGEATEALEALTHGDYRAADAARLLDAVRRGAIRAP